MKDRRMIIVILVICVLLGSAGSIYASSVPTVKLTVQEQVLDPQDYKSEVLTWKGLFFLKYQGKDDHAPYDIGETQASHLKFSVWDKCNLTITVKDASDKVLFQGSEAKYQNFRMQENGTYRYEVEARAPKSKTEAYGTFHFCFTTNLKLQPKITTGQTKVIQGDVLPIKVTDVPKGIIPTATSELGLSVFTGGNESFQTFVPVEYLKATGTYNVTVTVGDLKKVIPVEVQQGTFKKQYLTINKSNPVITEASSPKAYAQYREKIYPFFETADATVYWSGNFMQPVQGRITTEFGLLRYTNGSKTPSGHSGVDIAAPRGTPVSAPAAGRVVFSEYLLNTGNTLVIEHGGGLKSYFYHMDSLTVKVGDILTKGQNVGTVGTTGYSTGPHLHYDVRIGSKSINPWNLINGTGGFFAL